MHNSAKQKTTKNYIRCLLVNFLINLVKYETTFFVIPAKAGIQYRSDWNDLGFLEKSLLNKSLNIHDTKKIAYKK